MRPVLTVGSVVSFLHHWAANESKRRPGLVLAVDADDDTVVVCPGLSKASQWNEPIVFPHDFGGAPAGRSGLGIDHTTYFDLADLAKLPRARAQVMGRTPVPPPVLERVKSRYYELRKLGLVRSPCRRGC